MTLLHGLQAPRMSILMAIMIMIIVVIMIMTVIIM